MSPYLVNSKLVTKFVFSRLKSRRDKVIVHKLFQIKIFYNYLCVVEVMDQKFQLDANYENYELKVRYRLEAPEGGWGYVLSVAMAIMFVSINK